MGTNKLVFFLEQTKNAKDSLSATLVLSYYSSSLGKKVNISPVSKERINFSNHL
ncbi:hypothetical protein SAM19_04061 [Brevibacillus laterosporus]|nr:hypothetical protein [Brevibacillus laterosporus]